MIGDLAVVEKLINMELEDYDVTILELKEELENLVNCIEGYKIDTCLYYNS